MLAGVRADRLATVDHMGLFRLPKTPCTVTLYKSAVTDVKCNNATGPRKALVRSFPLEPTAQSSSQPWQTPLSDSS